MPHSRLTHSRTTVGDDSFNNAKKSLFELTAQVGSPFCAEVRPASTAVIATMMKLVFMFSVKATIVG